MSGEDWMNAANKRAKGRRPQYFEDPAVDRILSIVMAMAGEISVLRERQDTLERLLEQEGLLDRAKVEAYVPDAEAAFERGAATREYVSRILRGVQQDMEALQSDDAPVEQVSRDLFES